VYTRIKDVENVYVSITFDHGLIVCYSWCGENKKKIRGGNPKAEIFSTIIINRLYIIHIAI